MRSILLIATAAILTATAGHAETLYGRGAVLAATGMGTVCQTEQDYELMTESGRDPAHHCGTLKQGVTIQILSMGFFGGTELRAIAANGRVIGGTWFTAEITAVAKSHEDVAKLKTEAAQDAKQEAADDRCWAIVDAKLKKAGRGGVWEAMGAGKLTDAENKQLTGCKS